MKVLVEKFSSVSKFAPTILIELTLKGRIFRVCGGATITMDETVSGIQLEATPRFGVFTNTDAESICPMHHQVSDEMDQAQRQFRLPPI
mmetsp:Transcript_736/g.1351  ORF Transcript_736/g.1351 Transcript_736/m.1351 type:complete len:89 (+) Transcript_736:627-893(+)